MNEPNEANLSGSYEAAAANDPAANTSTTPTPRKKTEYTVAEGIFAILSLVFAYFFIDTLLFLPATPGIGAAVLVFGFAAFVLGYQLVNKIPFTARSIICLVLLLLTGTFLAISNSSDLRPVVFLFDMALGLYWLFITLGASTSRDLDYLAWFDALKAMIVLPFASFGRGFAAFFGGLFGRKKHVETEKKNHAPLYVILGLLIAVIPCSIVFSLLMKDDAFSALINKIIDFPEIHIGETILKLILAIPVSCYLFGAVFGAARAPRKESMTYESTHRAAKEVRFLPILLVCTVFIPLLLIYLLYFFSQTGYFLSAFANIRPDGYTYAEYARSGFFELCRVSVVNMIVIAAAEIFSRYNDRKPAVLKVFITILSAFTLALMAIAQSKIIMYIRAYGMTPLRVLTFWFTIVLGVLFVFIILYQYLPKINFTKCAAISLVALFCALLLSNTDALIARYNIDRSINDPSKKLDVYMLTEDLSDAAIPVIIEKFDSIPAGDDKTKLETALTARAQSLETPAAIIGSEIFCYFPPDDRDWRSWNYSEYRANKLILEKFGSK